MTNKPSNQCKIRHWIKAPIRLLSKTRNLYVKFMCSWADLAGHGDDMGLPPSYFCPAPSSSSPATSANDLQDLIRVTSKSNSMKIVGSKILISSNSDLWKKVEMEILQLKQQSHSQAMTTEVQRRKSCEVIETIDEDSPCEFSDDLKVRTDFLQQPTIRNSSVTKRIGVIV